MSPYFHSITFALIAACGVAPAAPPASAASHPSALAPEPLGASFWPTRVCTRGPGTIVVEKTCGCDDRMTCTTARRGSELDLRVHTDGRACKDCFPKITALCPLPRDTWSPGLGARSFRLTVDGRVALEQLTIASDGAVGIEPCGD